MSGEREPWCDARELLVPDAHGTVSFTDLAVWMHKHGAALLDVVEAAEACVRTWHAHGYAHNHIPDALALSEALSRAENSQSRPDA